jgi:chemotaxis protein methyltransferase CheR
MGFSRQQGREARLPAARLAEFQENYAQNGGRGNAAELPRVKSRITWSQYNLVTDASFNEFQAIICRRVLPDFGPMLRQRVLRLFHESLARFGVLGIDRELEPSDANAASYQAVFLQQPWYKRVE